MKKKKIQIYIFVDPKYALNTGSFGRILKEFDLNDFTEPEKTILTNALFSKKRKIFDLSVFTYHGYKFTQFPVSDTSLESVKKILADYKSQLEIFWLKRTDEQLLLYPITKVEKILQQVLPYDEEITNTEIDETNALYFTWRETQYRVTTNLFVKEVKKNLLIDNKVTLLIEQLLRLHKANITR